LIHHRTQATNVYTLEKKATKRYTLEKTSYEGIHYITKAMNEYTI